MTDGEAEEHHTMAIKSQNYLQATDAAELRHMDNAAIEKVKMEAWPNIRTADELHDALMILRFITEQEAQKGKQNDVLDFSWQGYFDELSDQSSFTGQEIVVRVFL